jgi:hypothetical protein
MSTYGGTTSNGEKTYEDQPPQPMEISTDFEAHGGTLEMPVRCIRDGKPRAVLLAAALCGIAVVLTVAYRATASRVHGAASEPLAPNSAAATPRPTPRPTAAAAAAAAAAEPPAPTPRPVGSSGSARTFYVDVAGSDAGAGTASRPFATARAAVRASRASLAAGAPSSEIAFGAGIHYVSEPIALGAGDGGTTLRGDDGAWLSGGLPVNATCWQLVLYKHPVYSAIWAAQTTDIEGDKAELHAQSSTQLTFLWKCDLRAALGGADPPATVDMLRVGDAYASAARFPDEGWLYASEVARASKTKATLTTVELVARDGSFYFAGDPSTSLPVGMMVAGFSCSCHVQALTTPFLGAVVHCVQINSWFGTSRPNFELL